MRGFDFAPLYRATVGFDRIADLMDRALTADVAQPTYPPYNIEKTADDAYRISIAVAGFTPEELSVEVREGALFVTADACLHAQPPEVAVKSTVGAGDAMVAGFIAGQLRGLSLADSARLATASAIGALTQLGPRLPAAETITSYMHHVTLRAANV